jgi:hypothetical protein
MGSWEVLSAVKKGNERISKKKHTAYFLVCEREFFSVFLKPLSDASSCYYVACCYNIHTIFW